MIAPIEEPIFMTLMFVYVEFLFMYACVCTYAYVSVRASGNLLRVCVSRRSSLPQYDIYELSINRR